VEKLVENHQPIAAAAASNREFHAVCTTMVRRSCGGKNETL
jgi:hypothetical protein